MTVKVDEAKFGKRKYRRGRLVNEVWILGGYFRETKEWFLIPKRDKETLMPIISENLVSGTTIMSIGSITGKLAKNECVN